MRVKTAFVFLCAAALAVTAVAQTKMSGTATCKANPPAPVAIGDRPGHAFSVSQAQCTWSKLEIAGSSAKEGTSAAIGETSGNTTSARGYHVGTMDNGDKWTCSFQGKTTAKDGKPVNDKGTWAFTQGTGKLKGIKGKGTFVGTPVDDATWTYQIEGEYSLP